MCLLLVRSVPVVRNCNLSRFSPRAKNRKEQNRRPPQDRLCVNSSMETEDILFTARIRGGTWHRKIHIEEEAV